MSSRDRRSRRSLRCGVFSFVWVFFSLILLAPAQAATATSGIVFVHGTGKQTDAYNDYWQKPIVDKVRAGLPNTNNFIVINCDFTQYWWHPDAAGCLAQQTTNFINSRGITDLYVITHSNGGNVLRWVMSNPTYDSRYPDIINQTGRVNALAPSSTGTPLSDAVMNGTVLPSSSRATTAST